MSVVDSIKTVLGRVRWTSVIALVLLIAAVFLLFQYFPTGYQVLDGVGIKATATPAKIAPGGSSSVDVEVKNMKSDMDVTVVIKGQTYDKNVFFDDTYAQTYGSQAVTLGPQESRKITLKLKSKPETLQGKYTLDFTAVPTGEDKGAQTRISLTVEKAA
jgi:hypothetical protein